MTLAPKRSFLVLEDGTWFSGFSDDEEGAYPGEVIFNTSMFGYQEVCTDPSYADQIVVFTYPHIGNVGTNEEDNESERCQLSGIVMREPVKKASNWRSKDNFHTFLCKQKIPSIYGVDTRKLTIYLREKGSQYGCIAIGNFSLQAANQLARHHSRSSKPDLFSQVSTQSAYSLCLLKPSSAFSVCVYDFGVKRSVLRSLCSLGCKVTVIPASFSCEQVLDLHPDGVVLSNGPGDPQKAGLAIKNIEGLLQNKIPLLGICFGCQLLALAAGGKIVKMKFGHHGANHPVIDLLNKKVFITSQNHGYRIADEGLPDSLDVTHRSLVDGSIEGIRFRSAPAFGFQGHPEGGPGPFDICGLFADFVLGKGADAKKSFS